MFAYVTGNPVNYVDPTGLALINVLNSFRNADPKVKGAISGLVSYGIQYASSNLPRGRLRGSLKLAAAGFSASSGVFFGGASISFFVITVIEPTVISKPAAFSSGVILGALAIAEFRVANKFLKEGFDELLNPNSSIISQQARMFLKEEGIVGLSNFNFSNMSKEKAK